MDIDHKDDADSLTNPDESSGIQVSPNLSSPSLAEYIDHWKISDKKWLRLRPQYHQRYLKLFEKSLEPEPEYGSWNSYGETRIGAVTWTSIEKARLYKAITQISRHDLPRISTYIRTKSQLEVKDYLDCLAKDEKDRQYFGDSREDYTHAETPAAVEIGEKCEEMLDGAANALIALEEQYNNVVERRIEGLPWFIDEYVAIELDNQSQKEEDDRNETKSQTSIEGYKIVSLFHMSKFPYLSECYFMHRGPSGQYEPWYEICEDGQTPTMTSAVLEEFYNIVTNLTRKLIQTCLYIAQSRIRSTTTDHRRPDSEISKADVLVALDLLNLKENTLDYWVRVARRNSLRVISGSRARGDSELYAIPYEEVEHRLLSNMTWKRYLDRFVPVNESHHDDQSEFEDINWDGVTSAGENNAAEESSVTSEHSSDSGTGIASDNPIKIEESESDGPSVSLDSDGITPSSELINNELSEVEADKYLEELDQMARRKEEAKLYRIFHVDTVERVNNDVLLKNFGPPKRYRDALKDQIGWSGTYEAEWERYGEIVPTDLFDDLSRPAKKPKTSSVDK